MSHNCHERICDDYVEYKPGEETVKVYGECSECYRPLVLLYGYTGTMDDETDEWLHRVKDYTERKLHDLLSRLISCARSGEWRLALDKKRELDDDLHALIAEGGN